MPQILEIEINKIESNPGQPRRVFQDETLEQLAESIKQYGILQPLVVSELPNGRYCLIAGERRLRAAELAGLKKVPVVLRSEEDEKERFVLSLIENIQREDLNLIDEAIAYQKLLEQLQCSQEELAKQVGKSRPVVANLIRLLKLPGEIQEEIKQGHISIGQAKAIMSLPTEEMQIKYTRQTIKKGLTSRELEITASEIKKPKKIAVVSKTDSELEMEEKLARLREALGTKIEIKKSPDLGRIIVEFYSDEDLDRLIRTICGKEVG